MRRLYSYSPLGWRAMTLDAGGWLVSDDIKIDIDLEVAESPGAVEESAEGEATQVA